MWEKAGDNRGSVVQQARHLERVVVIEERLVATTSGEGGSCDDPLLGARRVLN